MYCTYVCMYCMYTVCLVVSVCVFLFTHSLCVHTVEVTQRNPIISFAPLLQSSGLSGLNTSSGGSRSKVKHSDTKVAKGRWTQVTIKHKVKFMPKPITPTNIA